MAAATTLTDCSLARITRTAFIQLLRTEPDFAEMLAVYLVRQGQLDEEFLAAQLTEPNERRLARLLLRLAGVAGGGKTPLISTRFNQTELASMIGTTRARVSYFMNKFRRRGFIEYNRQGYVTVHKALSNVMLENSLSTGYQQTTINVQNFTMQRMIA